MSVRHPVVILISSHHSVGIRSFSPHLEVIPSSQCHSHPHNVIPSSRSHFFRHFDFIPAFHRHPVIFTSFRSHPIIPVPLFPSSGSHFDFIPSFHRHPIIFRSFEHHPVGPSRAAVPKSLGIVCIQPLGQPRLHP